MTLDEFIEKCLEDIVKDVPIHIQIGYWNFVGTPRQIDAMIEGAA